MPRRYADPFSAIVLLTMALFPAARADQSNGITLAPNTFLNLDTGVVSSTGGDILWNGTTLMPVGSAGTHNLGKYGSRAFKAIRARDASGASYGPAPLPAGTLVAGDVFGVHTNSGNYAKVLVTALNGTSLSLQYTTFIAAGAPMAAGAPAPVIAQVQNNYSYLLPGQPNYGIAPGSLFIVIGSGLSSSAPPALPSFSATPSLPLSLNQTSISVKVGGVTTTPALYYTSSTQLAAVLPSTTPAGNGTITVTYNGQPSAPAPIQVVASALGLDTLYGAGSGAGVVTNNNTGVTFGPANSVMPGQTAVLWGSGVGADTNNDDRTYPMNQDNLTNIPMQVYVGGISANILYRGRSQFPGVDQIDITIPANVSPGCFVSVTAVSGSIVSNTITLPVAPNGGPCSDAALGLSGTQLQSLANTGAPVNGLIAVVNQATNLSGTKTGAGVFAVSADASLFGSGTIYASPGSCTVVEPGQALPFSGALDPGTLQLTGPAGNLNLAGNGGGEYEAQLPAGPLTPGTYTFTGSGGANVGSFKVSIEVQTPLALTGTNALATITRSQGATLTWSGGFPNGYVLVDVVGQFAGNGSVNIYCSALGSGGQLAIPASALLALPAGGGDLFATNVTAPQTISATGLDLGLALGAVSFEVPTTFK
jgi:uncharacterized protein (TIGR03437 family)